MKKIGIIFGAIFCIFAAYGVTETITWHVDNTTSTTTCESGGDIILPNTPTKYGYAFLGWNVLLDYTIDGEERYSRCIRQDNSYICYSDTEIACNSNANVSNLNTNEWKVIFNYGTLYGNGLCSSSSGTYATSGNPRQTNGEHCWCTVIKLENTDGEETYLNQIKTYNNNFETFTNCQSVCAARCSRDTLKTSNFRKTLFGIK